MKNKFIKNHWDLLASYLVLTASVILTWLMISGCSAGWECLFYILIAVVGGAISFGISIFSLIKTFRKNLNKWRIVFIIPFFVIGAYIIGIFILGSGTLFATASSLEVHGCTDAQQWCGRLDKCIGINEYCSDTETYFYVSNHSCFNRTIYKINRVSTDYPTIESCQAHLTFKDRMINLFKRFFGAFSSKPLATVFISNTPEPLSLNECNALKGACIPTNQECSMNKIEYGKCSGDLKCCIEDKCIASGGKYETNLSSDSKVIFEKKCLCPEGYQESIGECIKVFH